MQNIQQFFDIGSTTAGSTDRDIANRLEDYLCR